MEKQLKAIILLVSIGLVRPELYFSELKLNWFGATTVIYFVQNGLKILFIVLMAS